MVETLANSNEVSEDHLTVVSAVLAMGEGLVNQLDSALRVKILDGLKSVVMKFCEGRQFSVKLKLLRVTCNGWLGDDHHGSIITINRNIPLMKLYRDSKQTSDFTMLTGPMSLRRTSSTPDQCVGVSYVDSTQTRCSVYTTVPGDDVCVCPGNYTSRLYYRTSKLAEEDQMSSRSSDKTTFIRSCHIVTLILLLLSFFGLLSKGSLDVPLHSLFLNLVVCSLACQAVLTALTLQDGRCLFLTLAAEYLHPAVLSWSLGSLVLFVKSDPSVVGYGRGTWLVAKLCLVNYLLNLSYPIAHLIYCYLTPDTCVVSRRADTTCRDMMMITPERLTTDIKTYTFLLPAGLLTLSHLALYSYIASSLIGSRKRAGRYQTLGRAKYLVLYSLPACVLSVLQCSVVLGNSQVLQSCYGLMNVLFGLMLGLGIMGSIHKALY